MKKYQTEFKLKVVSRFLAGDGGAKLLARQWSVPEEKIRTWVSHDRLHGIDGFGRRSAPGMLKASAMRTCRTFCSATSVRPHQTRSGQPMSPSSM